MLEWQMLASYAGQSTSPGGKVYLIIFARWRMSELTQNLQFGPFMKKKKKRWMVNARKEIKSVLWMTHLHSLILSWVFIFHSLNAKDLWVTQTGQMSAMSLLWLFLCSVFPPNHYRKLVLFSGSFQREASWLMGNSGHWRDKGFSECSLNLSPLSFWHGLWERVVTGKWWEAF